MTSVESLEKAFVELESKACDGFAHCALKSSCVVNHLASQWDDWPSMFVILQYRALYLHPELLLVANRRNDKQYRESCLHPELLLVTNRHNDKQYRESCLHPELLQVTQNKNK